MPRGTNDGGLDGGVYGKVLLGVENDVSPAV
jgi:hypothetical protein